MVAELKRDEGDRGDIYDDSTGAAIKAGYTVKGTPTLGSGITGPFDDVERAFLLNRRIDRAQAGLAAALPWFLFLDDVRQRAVVNMAFNLGVAGLLAWPNTMRYMAAKDYLKAADEIENSHPWIDQVGARGHRIAAMIRTGVAVGVGK